MERVARLSSSLTRFNSRRTIFLDVYICLLFARDFARLIVDVRTMFVKI